MMTFLHRILLALLALMALAVRPALGVGEQGYTTLGSGYETLKSQFDADVGKVRAIFLASPT